MFIQHYNLVYMQSQVSLTVLAIISLGACHRRSGNLLQWY